MYSINVLFYIKVKLPRTPFWKSRRDKSHAKRKHWQQPWKYIPLKFLQITDFVVFGLIATKVKVKTDLLVCFGSNLHRNRLTHIKKVRRSRSALSILTRVYSYNENTWRERKNAEEKEQIIFSWLRPQSFIIILLLCPLNYSISIQKLKMWWSLS